MAFATMLTRSFPVPPYLTLPAAGIDISQGAVRAIVFNWDGEYPTVSGREQVQLKPGIIVDGDIEKPDELVEVLRSVRLKKHIRAAHVSLPERKAYLYQALVPPDEHDMRAAVEFDLESHVPIPPAEALFDFEVVRRTEAGTVVSVTAYARRIVEEYLGAFRRAGIVVKSLEVESQAIERALVSSAEQSGVCMIVDFGKHTTRIAVIDHGTVAFTATVEVGGDALTAAVTKHFKVGEAEAETIKNERGFLEGGKNRPLFEALMTTVSVLKDEVVQHLAYWNSGKDAIVRAPIERIIIVGGNANLKGLPEYLSQNVDLPVMVANVWRNAFSLDRYVPPLTFEESLEYSATIGLALRSNPSRPW